MCPFCIAALAAIAAKTLAAGGGAALAAKLALKSRSESASCAITAEPDESDSARGDARLAHLS